MGTPEFAPLEPRGNSSTLGANLTYPLVRSAARNVFPDLGAERKRPYNATITGVSSDYEIRNLLLKLDANQFDSIGAGGITSLNLTHVLGHVNLSGSPARYVNADASRYRLTRVQRLSESWTLQGVFSGQTANKNLDAAEKFFLGGPYGVRAYPVNEAGGFQGPNAQCAPALAPAYHHWRLQLGVQRLL